MFGHQFYNETTRRYVATFGTLFNDIIITRKDNSGNTVQSMKVPIAYGPKQKFLARLEQDPSLSAPAMTLPRMSFELLTMTYAPDRKLTRLLHDNTPRQITGNTYKTQFAAVPYNLDFELNIMTKYNEDGTKILEQIIPFFKPEQVLSVELIEDSNMFFDIPIVLNSVQHTDDYEGDFESRRALIWTLNFTVKGYFFGPTIERKVVKFARTRIFDKLDAQLDFEIVNGGTPTEQPVALTYNVYMNAFLDELGNPLYGISDIASTDATHDQDETNIFTTPFELNEVLPE